MLIIQGLLMPNVILRSLILTVFGLLNCNDIILA